jgi:glucosamine kinase
MGEPLFLGIDGGGTRCRARLETADGAVLGRGLAGPASMRFGLELVRDSILAATRQALREAGLGEAQLLDIYAGIGLAGTGHVGAREALESWTHPFAGAWFEGDGYTAYLGAFNGGEGGIVIAGTGSIGITFLGKTVRVGGYGFPVSDEGSGADIGLNAIRHALRTLDGRETASPFSQEVMARFHNDPARVIKWATEGTATEYASLAPIVTRHAASGDASAQKLLRNAAAAIAEMAAILLDKGVPQVAVVGGLASILTPYIVPEIASRLVQPQADAMAGGILLAKMKSGVGANPQKPQQRPPGS